MSRVLDFLIDAIVTLILAGLMVLAGIQIL